MEDDKVEELTDVDPYHGPQQGLSIWDHICQTIWLKFLTFMLSWLSVILFSRKLLIGNELI